ncbi:MAG: glycosyltransferase family 2 protein [Oscillospiraceae bacterium]|nr:glycosyltransferase family 2 protein [Oscillospiraceae bacterium]
MYSLVLVDYNTIDITTQYVERCWNAFGAKGAGHVVIVENGANDGIPEKLDSLYGEHTMRSIPGISQPVYVYQNSDRQIVYCNSGENLGYARGNNLGIRIALQVFADTFCIISNNDIVFPEPVDLTIADRLFAEHPEIGILGPGVTTPEGERQSPNNWQTAFQRLFLFYWKPLIRLLDKCRRAKSLPAPKLSTGPCDWVSGCFMLVKMEAMEKADMFDGNTFLYAEELILSRRMEAVGYSTWFCAELNVVHKHAQTTKKALSALRGKEINFDSIWYYYKNYTDTPPLVLTLAKANFFIHKTVYFCAHKLKDLFKPGK